MFPVLHDLDAACNSPNGVSMKEGVNYTSPGYSDDGTGSYTPTTACTWTIAVLHNQVTRQKAFKSTKHNAHC